MRSWLYGTRKYELQSDQWLPCNSPTLSHNSVSPPSLHQRLSVTILNAKDPRGCGEAQVNCLGSLGALAPTPSTPPGSTSSVRPPMIVLRLTLEETLPLATILWWRSGRKKAPDCILFSEQKHGNLANVPFHNSHRHFEKTQGMISWFQF